MQEKDINAKRGDLIRAEVRIISTASKTKSPSLFREWTGWYVGVVQMPYNGNVSRDGVLVMQSTHGDRGMLGCSMSNVLKVERLSAGLNA